ncbi:hypothetical protein BG32_16180, partial [Mesotoga sp. HF07.pep.5.2.highcov]
AVSPSRYPLRKFSIILPVLLTVSPKRLICSSFWEEFSENLKLHLYLLKQWYRFPLTISRTTLFSEIGFLSAGSKTRFSRFSTDANGSEFEVSSLSWSSVSTSSNASSSESSSSLSSLVSTGLFLKDVVSDLNFSLFLPFDFSRIFSLILCLPI